MASSLRIVPLGGLGEIGMNCMAVEQGSDLVLVDCGVMFPFRELGVDVIHPSFEWVLARRDQLRGVVLTHGHEDHIGAVPYLLREVSVPVYGPPHALTLVRYRMREEAPHITPDLRPTEPRRPFELGSFGIEPVRVTHSIPDATALILTTGVGTVVHTGDFNIDEEPLDGQHFDADRLAEVGESGVRLLLSDSTNVDFEGDSGRERTVVDTLERVVTEAPHRVVVSLFASNLHRLAAVIELARRTGRKLLLLGRSLRTHVRAGVELGRLRDPSALLVPEDRVQDFPRERLLVVATGTQGEAPAALARLASGRHPVLRLEPGDTAILSSRIIPGHEQTVFAMVNNLLRRGVEVVTRLTEPGIHVSGHAAREEQRRMVELVQPRAFMPVHGTYHHLTRHAQLARDAGVDDTLVVENGAVVEVDDTGMRVADRAPVGRVHVDAGEPIHEDVLRDRALLGELGMALVVLQVDREGRLASPPEIVTRGVIHDEAEAELVSGAQQHVADVLGGQGPRPGDELPELEERARRALRRYLVRSLGRKPLTYAVAVHVP
ncbi:MAG: ribonuclease J [Myxococcota bacterium]